MAYNILAINPFHNGSACVLSDGEVAYYLEEERLSRLKNDPNPFRVILDILNRFKIDEVVLAGINTNNVKLGYSREDPFYALIRKHLPHISTYIDYSSFHHKMHLNTAFFNSKFEEALGIVIDAGGSLSEEDEVEIDTLYIASKKENTFEIIYEQKLTNPQPLTTYPMNIGMVYGSICNILGFKVYEEGKVMGLSSYGKYNKNIPVFFDVNSGRSTNHLQEKTKENLERTRAVSNEFIHKVGLNQGLLFNSDHQVFKPIPKPKKQNFTELEVDLAWHVQKDLEKYLKKLVVEFVKKTGIKNIVCSGGVFLNCVANYYLTKEFPDINFYFEPIAHDGGTAIGAAYTRWKELNPEFKGKKQSTLYYGPQYSKEELLEGIKKYN